MNKSSHNCAQELTLLKWLYCHAAAHQINNWRTFGSLEITQRYNFDKSNALFLNCPKKNTQLQTVIALVVVYAKVPIIRYYIDKNLNKAYKYLCWISTTTKTTVLNTSFVNTSSNNNMVLLVTAVVQIRDKYGNLQNAHVMPDSGPQIYIITE